MMRTVVLLLLLWFGAVPIAFAADGFAVLVFSKTAGYRHDSIPAGVAAIRAIGEQDGFRVDATEDAVVFTDANLANYRVVIFLSTSGEVFDTAQQAAFENFIRRGGGFVGIHAASDTGYDWPWYGGLVGNYFRRHPVIQQAMLVVVDPSHPSTRHLPIRWTRSDEWYDFRNDLADDITVLIRDRRELVWWRPDGCESSDGVASRVRRRPCLVYGAGTYGVFLQRAFVRRAYPRRGRLGGSTLRHLRLP